MSCTYRRGRPDDEGECRNSKKTRCGLQQIAVQRERRRRPVRIPRKRGRTRYRLIGLYRVPEANRHEIPGTRLGWLARKQCRSSAQRRTEKASAGQIPVLPCLSHRRRDGSILPWVLQRHHMAVVSLFSLLCRLPAKVLGTV